MAYHGPPWRTSPPTGCPRWRSAPPGRNCARPSPPALPRSARPSPDDLTARPSPLGEDHVLRLRRGQVEAITNEAEIHALDRALVVISVDPDIGEPIPATAAGPRLREFTDDVERVRLLYWTSALGTVVVVAYIEV